MLSNAGTPWTDFRGDFEALSALIQRVWQGNTEQPLEYTPGYLASCFDYPGTTLSTAPTLYVDDKPAAFIAGFPRKAVLQGTPRNLGLITFLTADPELKGSGASAWAEALRRARAAGLDGTISYCVEGNRSNDLTVMMAKALRLPVERVFTIRYLMRFLKPQAGPELPEASAADLMECSELVQAPLRRVWTEPEANWQLHRPGAVSTILQKDGRKGVLVGYILRSADRDRTPCVFLDDVLWGNLNDADRTELVQGFLTRASRSASLAVLPQLGYADLKSFEQARFRLSTRALNAYLVLWNCSLPGPLSGLYMDVM